MFEVTSDSRSSAAEKVGAAGTVTETANGSAATVIAPSAGKQPTATSWQRGPDVDWIGRPEAHDRPGPWNVRIWRRVLTARSFRVDEVAPDVYEVGARRIRRTVDDFYRRPEEHGDRLGEKTLAAS